MKCLLCQSVWYYKDSYLDGTLGGTVLRAGGCDLLPVEALFLDDGRHFVLPMALYLAVSVFLALSQLLPARDLGTLFLVLIDLRCC